MIALIFALIALRNIIDYQLEGLKDLLLLLEMYEDASNVEPLDLTHDGTIPLRDIPPIIS